jgi:hypothetical protein
MAALLSDTPKVISTPWSVSFSYSYINLNAQNTLLNQSGDITANNNLNLTAKTLTNNSISLPMPKYFTIIHSITALVNINTVGNAFECITHHSLS